jgi:ectoine hydroxylase-related dioxygenase (phytanoyl-CoA dioxygenase family)
VPTYESMVFKQEGDGQEIPWRQDPMHPRRHRIFNFAVYLDASRTGAGALRVVPGSQTL